MLDQTYPEIEYIVIDGGSTDQTLSILERYSDRVSWVSEPDKGQSDAINKGWKMAKGEIIAYLNADDTYLPDRVESVVTYLITHPETSLVYGDGVFEDEQGRKIADYRAGPFNMGGPLPGQYPSAIGLFSPVPPRDRWLSRRVAASRHGPRLLDQGRLRPSDQLPAQTAIGSKNIWRCKKSSAFLTKYVEEYEYILQKVFDSPDTPPHILAKRSEIYSYVYVKGGLDALCHGQIVQAGVYLALGLKSNPVHALRTGIQLVTEFGRERWSKGNRQSHSIT